MNAMTRVFILSALLMLPAISNGDDYDNLNISYIVNYRGKCTVLFDDAGKNSTGTCKGPLVIAVFKHGRIQYYFPYTEKGVAKLIAFSGGADRQPSLSHYELDIDTVINSDFNSRATQKFEAKGLCTMDGDPNAMATFKCGATILAPGPDTITRYEFVFESTGVEGGYVAPSSP